MKCWCWTAGVLCYPFCDESPHSPNIVMLRWTRNSISTDLLFIPFREKIKIISIDNGIIQIWLSSWYNPCHQHSCWSDVGTNGTDGAESCREKTVECSHQQSTSDSHVLTPHHNHCQPDTRTIWNKSIFVVSFVGILQIDGRFVSP